MYEQIHKNEKGFVALISAIIVSVTLLLFTLAVSFEGYHTRFAVLNSDFKEKSNYLAESCVYTALIEVLRDDNFHSEAFPQTIVVGGDICTIIEVDTLSFPGEYRIFSKGVFDRAVTNLEVNVDVSDSSDVTIDSWEEVDNL